MAQKTALAVYALPGPVHSFVAKAAVDVFWCVKDFTVFVPGSSRATVFLPGDSRRSVFVPGDSRRTAQCDH